MFPAIANGPQVAFGSRRPEERRPPTPEGTASLRGRRVTTEPTPTTNRFTFGSTSPYLPAPIPGRFEGQHARAETPSPHGDRVAFGSGQTPRHRRVIAEPCHVPPEYRSAPHVPFGDTSRAARSVTVIDTRRPHSIPGYIIAIGLFVAALLAYMVRCIFRAL